MIKIEIDDDKRDVCAQGTDVDIMFETAIAVETILASMAEDSRGYYSLLTAFIKGLTLDDYDEIKEMMESE